MLLIFMDKIFWNNQDLFPTNFLFLIPHKFHASNFPLLCILVLHFSQSLPLVFISFSNLSFTDFEFIYQRVQKNIKIILMKAMYQQMQFFTDPSYIQAKLQSILVCLQNENDEVKRYYGHRIEELQNKLTEKQKEVRLITKQYQQIKRKYQTLEWKVLEKQNLIEDLNKKIKNIQLLFKDRLIKLIHDIDLTGSDSENWKGFSAPSQKRINISQYFIKAMEASKGNIRLDNKSTKVDDEAPSTDMSDQFRNIFLKENPLHKNSDPTDKFLRNNFSRKLQKVKSLGSQQFLKYKYFDGIDENLSEYKPLLQTKQSQNGRKTLKQANRLKTVTNSPKKENLNLNGQLYKDKDKEKRKQTKQNETERRREEYKQKRKGLIQKRTHQQELKWKQLSAFEKYKQSRIISQSH